MGKIIKNPEPLETSYIPGYLINRDIEIDSLRKNVVFPVMRGLSSNIFIYGQSGTGKTVTLRFLASMETGCYFHYENAISVGSFKRIVVKILSSLGKQVSEKQPFDSLFMALKRSTSMPIILVVDECLNLVKTDPDGLYNVLRSAELYDLRMGLILASVDNPALHMTSREIRRIGIFNEMKFNKYSTSDLSGILDHRSKESLYDGVIEPDIIDGIASISERSGSARMAIEILQKAAFISDYDNRRTIDMETVRKASAMINPYITESKLMELDQKELLILLSICQILERNIDATMEHITDQIGVNFETRDQPIPDLPLIYRAIRHLESLDIVEGVRESLGRGKGVKKRFFMGDLPVSVLIQKIFEIIE